MAKKLSASQTSSCGTSAEELSEEEDGVYVSLGSKKSPDAQLGSSHRESVSDVQNNRGTFTGGNRFVRDARVGVAANRFKNDPLPMQQDIQTSQMNYDAFDQSSNSRGFLDQSTPKENANLTPVAADNGFDNEEIFGNVVKPSHNPSEGEVPKRAASQALPVAQSSTNDLFFRLRKAKEQKLKQRSGQQTDDNDDKDNDSIPSSIASLMNELDQPPKDDLNHIDVNLPPLHEIRTLRSVPRWSGLPARGAQEKPDWNGVEE